MQTFGKTLRELLKQKQTTQYELAESLRMDPSYLCKVVNDHISLSTQSCSGCGHQRKKPLSERMHDCPKCKLKLPRDRNAPRCMLNWVLFGTVFDPNSGLERAEVCRASGDAPVQESPAIVVL